jgi:hypothetical protein
MNGIRKVFAVFALQLRQIFSSWRIPGVFALVGIFVWSNTQQIGDFAKLVGLNARPWLFCHLTNDFVCQLVFSAACIGLFCDAPFQTDLNTYVLLRSGRTAQIIGQTLYIAALSLVFVLFILAVSIFALFPAVEFADGWGKVLGTLARTDASAQAGVTFMINDFLIGAYTPITATVLSVLLEWACFTWLGLVVFLFNGRFGKMSGIFIAGAFILLDVTVANELTPFAYHFSPISLAQLSAFAGFNARFGLSLDYASAFFVVGIAALTIANLMFRRKDTP